MAPTSGDLPPLSALRAFEAAARHSSFTEAAGELHVSQAAVSQQIRTLENHLQRQLFHRTPRGLYLSEAGEAYLPVVQDSLERLGDGTARLFGPKSDVKISIKVITTLGVGWLAHRLGRLKAAFPDISLSITTFQWNSDAHEEFVDLEIRYGSGEWPDLIVEPLMEERIAPVCSPEIINGSKRLLKPRDVLEHPLLRIVATRDDWPEWLHAAGVKTSPPDPEIQLDSTLMAYCAAEDGLGIALGRTLLVEKRLREGSLVAPFDFWVPTRETYYLVRKANSRKRAQIDRICDWLKNEAQAYLSS